VSVTLDIPDAVSQAMGLPPGEIEQRLRLELAISLYSQNILGLGKAAELARLDRAKLNEILASRGIPMHYSKEDLAEDSAYAGLPAPAGPLTPGQAAELRGKLAAWEEDWNAPGMEAYDRP
jgi:predicted HTH domain antitoxin